MFEVYLEVDVSTCMSMGHGCLRACMYGRVFEKVLGAGNPQCMFDSNLHSSFRNIHKALQHVIVHIKTDVEFILGNPRLLNEQTHILYMHFILIIWNPPGHSLLTTMEIWWGCIEITGSFYQHIEKTAESPLRLFGKTVFSDEPVSSGYIVSTKVWIYTHTYRNARTYSTHTCMSACSHKYTRIL